METKSFKPYVPADSTLKELTVKAMVLGVLMAIVLGAANAYVGMKAGLTVAATFPAAVVAMAALRLFKGTILEENIARTTASVGEALVAGAIFTIPAFVITGVWEELRYLESMAIMLIGGVLGVLFVVLLRRSLVEEADLPFPESVATAEIVKAGQGGQTGANYLFAAMGLAALWEFIKNSSGFQLIADSSKGFFSFAKSNIEIVGQKITYGGGFFWETPAASPMLTGVGFIIGMRVSAVLFCGAVIGWLCFVPLGIFFNPSLEQVSGGNWLKLAEDVWYRQIRPFAVGTMIVAAFYTLYGLKSSLFSGMTKAIADLKRSKDSEKVTRLDLDIDFKKIVISIGLVAIPLFLLYNYFAQNFVGALILTVVLLVLGFLFAAVAGYLVGIVGSSNNPISGLTLSSLLISAILLVLIGVTGNSGIMAVLGVAGVVCVAAGIAGDMMQDLKVGHMLGGTPWKMEVAEIIGVVIAAFFMPLALWLMHDTYVIGSANLPAPQAGLMALMSQGIVGGEMAWPLVVAGMIFATALILIKAPSPMLIAVGMYLPFSSTSAIFVGGVLRWFMDYFMEKKRTSEEGKTKAENTGILISSGLIAGESLMAVLLALIVGISNISESTFSLKQMAVDMGISSPSSVIGLIVFAALAYLLIKVPLKASRK